MSTVRDWFKEFMDTLVGRSGRTDWPTSDSESGFAFWDNFERTLRRMGATFAQADEASSVVCETPDLWPNKFLPLVVQEIKKLQARAVQDSKGLDVAGSLEDARLASAGCLDCGGNGSAVRFVHADVLGKLKTASGKDVPVGYMVSFPCSCPLGHHVARGQAKPGKPSPPTIDQHPGFRRTPCPWSIAEDGLDNQYRHDPDNWDSYQGLPILAECPTHDLASLKRLTFHAKAPRSLSERAFDSEREKQRQDIDRRMATPSRSRNGVAIQPEKSDIVMPEDEPGWF